MTNARDEQAKEAILDLIKHMREVRKAAAEVERYRGEVSEQIIEKLYNGSIDTPQEIEQLMPEEER